MILNMVPSTDPNVSEEAKEHAHDILEERDAL